MNQRMMLCPMLLRRAHAVCREALSRLASHAAYGRRLRDASATALVHRVSVLRLRAFRVLSGQLGAHPCARVFRANRLLRRGLDAWRLVVLTQWLQAEEAKRQAYQQQQQEHQQQLEAQKLQAERDHQEREERAAAEAAAAETAQLAAAVAAEAEQRKHNQAEEAQAAEMQIAGQEEEAECKQVFEAAFKEALHAAAQRLVKEAEAPTATVQTATAEAGVQTATPTPSVQPLSSPHSPLHGTPVIDRPPVVVSLADLSSLHNSPCPQINPQQQQGEQKLGMQPTKQLPVTTISVQDAAAEALAREWRRLFVLWR